MSSENEIISTASQQTAATAAPSQEQVRLVDAVIHDQNVALNVIVGFIGVAQKRGCFAIDESAKIFECIKMFQGASTSN
ncbi:MAG: hypothetical protein V3S42_04320 [Candidatus Neomarinimicrobiota bacterium]